MTGGPGDKKKPAGISQRALFYVNRFNCPSSKLVRTGEFDLVTSYFLLQSESLLLLFFANSSSLASRSTSLAILNEQLFVAVSHSTSSAPIPVRAVRTAPAQPPQLIAGTLSDTSCISLEVEAEALLSPSVFSAGALSAGFSGAAGSPHPMMPASNASARQESRVRILRSPKIVSL